MKNSKSSSSISSRMAEPPVPPNGLPEPFTPSWRKRHSRGSSNAAMTSPDFALGPSSTTFDSSSSASGYRPLQQPGDHGLRPVVTTPESYSSRQKVEPTFNFRNSLAGFGNADEEDSISLAEVQKYKRERPFKCVWPGCNVTFLRQHDCKRHEQLHLSVRPDTTCKGCQKTFARLDAFNRHLLSKENASCRRAQQKQDEATPGPSLTPPSVSKRRPPPPRPGRKRRASLDAAGPSSSKRFKVTSSQSTEESLSEVVEPEEPNLSDLEDIADLISLSSDQPTNVTGHFCDLFEGQHVTYGKVALKRPRIGPHEYSSQDVRRFRREADTWRGFTHEHILRFIGTCRIGGFLFMVSPYIDNGTLSGYVERHPEVDRVRLLYETALALAYLHRCGVIHGDIKATNILVSDDVHALLCDFGLTKFASTSTSTALKSAGSLRWQSPELWEENRPKTFESDIYAFAMTIAEVLSGQIPFAKYEQACSVIMAAGIRNERPLFEPMFSPTGAPYYQGWRAAFHCWGKDPGKRLVMDRVVEMLAPIQVHLQPPRLRPPTPDPGDRLASVGKMALDLGFGADPRMLGAALFPSSHDAKTDDDEDGEDGEGSYCYCGRDSYGDMVACDTEGCKIEWFHVECLGLPSIPETPWYCLSCESTRLQQGLSGPL